MSVVTDIVAGIASSVGKAAIDIRTAITGIDPATQGKLAEIAANLEAQQAKAETDLLQGQLEVAKVEAASTKMFIAGARPYIMWICGTVIAYTYIIAPVLLAFGVKGLPTMNMAELWPVLTGMLGLGGMRTYEKLKGVAGSH